MKEDMSRDFEEFYEGGYAFGMYMAVKIIAAALYGKEMYFEENHGVIYSRVSEKYVTEEQALKELEEEILKESV